MSAFGAATGIDFQSSIMRTPKECQQPTLLGLIYLCNVLFRCPVLMSRSISAMIRRNTEWDSMKFGGGTVITIVH